MISLCMIVKASDDEAVLLDRCLFSAAKYFDEINLTITGENKSCEIVARKYKAKVSHFEWINDFSKARNFNFSQATGDYIMWLDCDDVFKGGELIAETVKNMEENHVDAVIMPYLYDFDDNGLCTVRHNKTRIVKNDGTFTWVGAVHEDFEANREIKQFLDEKIEILHLKGEKEAKESADRNILIAKSEYKKAKNDPRTHYLMANAYLANRDEKNALRYLKTFVELSQSDEEKYLAYINMFDISKEVEYLTKAWLLRPAYPNVYIKLGEYYFNEKKYNIAKNFVELGLQMPKPDDSIIVFNPREYDYVPLTLMTNICFELGEYTKSLAFMELIQKIYPKDEAIKSKKKAIEKILGDTLKAEDVIAKLSKIGDKKYLKHKLDNLSPALKAHPKICTFRNENFIKETSTGKDIAYYCSYTVKEWTPKSATEGGVGGSEEAVINISKNLAKQGWNVTVYNNCGKNAGVYDGVTYEPFWAYNVRDKWDKTIIWRHPKTVDYLDERAGDIYVDMHDVVQDGEFTKERVQKIKKVFVKTNAHRILFPSVPDEKIAIIPNGIDTSMFEEKVEKNPYLILNTSSPDRHLEATLDIFEELIKRQPEKPWKLAWYYGWGVYDDVHKDNKEMMDWKDTQMARFDSLKAQGKAEGGNMISHTEVAKKYLEAGIFLYPTQFYEIHCISALKAQAAGCFVVASDFAALAETVKTGYRVHTKGEKWGKDSTFGDSENKDEYIKGLLCYGSADIPFNKEEFDWKEITKQWIEQIS